MTVWHCKKKLGWFLKSESEKVTIYGFYCPKCDKQFLRKVAK